MANGASGGGAIWVAIIGALATGGGYLFTYYKDISIQERTQQHDLVIKLLTEDSRESSRNLVWAHEAGLINLSPQTVESLVEKPYEGPTRSSGEGTEGTATLTDIIPSEDIVALVRGLDAGTKSLRSQALQTLLNETAGSEEKTKEAVLASIAALSGDQLEALSANGRYNILYFLDRADWSLVDTPTKAQTKTTLEWILTRANEGLAAVGPQTQGIIASVDAQL